MRENVDNMTCGFNDLLKLYSKHRSDSNGKYYSIVKQYTLK